MDLPYKIQIKLGDAEFSAEGPEATVKDAYDRFLQALAARPTQPPSPQQGQQVEKRPPTDGNGATDTAFLSTAFEQHGELVALRHLPPAENPNRAADAAILILYGYRMLLELDSVPVMRLTASLRRSGISVERLDRFIGVHSALYMKGGQKSGGRYTLNNQGVRAAETWIDQWFR